MMGAELKGRIMKVKKAKKECFGTCFDEIVANALKLDSHTHTHTYPHALI